MKPYLHFKLFCLFVIYILQNNTIFSQCTGGRSTANINWDYQYYDNTVLPPSGINFMLGKNTLRMTWSSATFRGVMNEHTNHTGSFGNGNDVKFDVRNGLVTFTFLEPVQDLRFTVYDIDNRQTFAPRAYDVNNNPLNITLSRAAGGSSGTLSLNNTPTPSYYYTNGAGLNSNTGAINVTVPGLTDRITLNFYRSSSTSGTDPIYISDISACTNSTWATDYQAISAPETGQPTHMLIAYDSIIYIVNKLDNTALELYAETTMNRINTVAYDPYNQIIYFCDSRRDALNLSVYKYDVKTGVRSTFINNVNTFGIQTFTKGLATSGAGFYDGYLFIGTDSDQYLNTPTAIYRIDIDPATGNALRASRFWGQNSAVDNSGNTDILYDWGDFVVTDGVLYNFNSAGDAAPTTEMQHFSLNSQTKLAGYDYTPDTLAQASLDYEGNIFSIRQGFYYQTYNPTSGALGAHVHFSGIPSTRVLCDGAESFKYPYDYGDAPSSYGYASHIFRVAPNLMIGSTVDYEMNGYYSAGADDDDNDIRGIGNDEDGVNVNYFVTNPISETNTTYTVPIQLTNRTGADAYLYGYIDFNNDGDYNDAGERSQLVTVPNHPLTQPYSVAWTSLAGGVPGNSFIRFRIGSDEPEINTGSGYARSGEVEDYPIGIHASTLPVELTTFTATALENHTTQLNWATASELNNDHFEIQRSTGDNNWSAIGTVNGNGNSSMLINYSFIDEQPENGINYYRLKQVDYDGTFEYTIVVAVTHNSSIEKNNPVEISVFPNPTTDVLWVKSNYSTPTVSQENIDVYNTNGQQVYSTPHQENLQQVDLKYYENGMYYLKIGKQTFKIIKK